MIKGALKDSKDMNINAFKASMTSLFSAMAPETDSSYAWLLSRADRRNPSRQSKTAELWISTDDVAKAVAKSTVRIMSKARAGAAPHGYAGSTSGRVSRAGGKRKTRIGFSDENAALRRWWPSLRAHVLKSGAARSGATIITVGGGMGLIAAKLGATMRKRGAAVVTIATSAPSSDDEAYLLDLLDSRNVLVCRPTYGLTPELFDALDARDRFRFGIVGADAFIPALLPTGKRDEVGEDSEDVGAGSSGPDTAGAPGAFDVRKMGDAYFFDPFGGNSAEQSLIKVKQRLNRILSLSKVSFVEVPTWIALKRSLEVFPGGTYVIEALMSEFGFPSLETLNVTEMEDFDPYDAFGEYLGDAKTSARGESRDILQEREERSAYLKLLQSAADLGSAANAASVSYMSTTRSGVLGKGEALTWRFKVVYEGKETTRAGVSIHAQCARQSPKFARTSFACTSTCPRRAH